jgi:hypothetical protein
MFMGSPLAVPLDTMLNFMDSALSASATMVLVVLLSGSLHSTLASNLLPEELVTVVLQDLAMWVGLKLARSSFLRQCLLTVGFPAARLPAFFMAASILAR